MPNQIFIKKSVTVFLQAITLLIGVAVLIFMLWEPHLEGRNAGATFFEVYTKDPFLVWAYTASISFFVALYQIFKLLGLVRQDEIFSTESTKALRAIQYCSAILIVFLVAGEAYLHIVVRSKDDIAGGSMIGFVLILVAATVAATTYLFEKIVQDTLEKNPKS